MAVNGAESILRSILIHNTIRWNAGVEVGGRNTFLIALHPLVARVSTFLLSIVVQ